MAENKLLFPKFTSSSLNFEQKYQLLNYTNANAVT